MLDASANRTVRRLSPNTYKTLLAAHILTSVSWLGIVVAKIALGLAAVSATQVNVEDVLVIYTSIMNPLFPPAAILTILTGVLLSLGTRWGLLDHYWVVAKLILSIAVIVTAVRIGDRMLEQTLNVPAGSLGNDRALLGVVATALTALSMSIAHAGMLALATILSVFKPWGRTCFGQHSRAL